MATWLAIDDEGCIGAFAYEVGVVVPRAAVASAVDRFPLHALGAVRWTSAGQRWPLTPKPGRGRRVLAVLDPALGAETSYRSGAAASAFEEAVGPDGVWVVRAAEPRVIATLVPIDDAMHAALVRDRTIVRVYDEHRLASWIEGEADVGLFRGSAVGPSDPHRYERSSVPTDPIRIHELPEETQRAIRVVRLRTRFRKADLVFLDDLVPPDACVLSRERPSPRPSIASVLARDLRTLLGQRRAFVAVGAAVGVHVVLGLLLGVRPW